MRKEMTTSPGNDREHNVVGRLPTYFPRGRGKKQRKGKKWTGGGTKIVALSDLKINHENQRFHTYVCVPLCHGPE